MGGEEYDYYYVYSNKRKIIECIYKPYSDILNRDLCLCVIDEKSLRNFVTTKKQKKKDPLFTLMPLENKVDLQKYLYQPVFIIQNPSDYDNISIPSRIKISRQSLYCKRIEYNDVVLDDFKIIKVIGRGSFGKVCLVEFLKNNELYAMKSLKKDVLIGQNQIENTLLEKKILKYMDHPFLCSLEFCFQTIDRIHLIMPFMIGGELFQIIRKMRFLTEDKYKNNHNNILIIKLIIKINYKNLNFIYLIY
jgi:hypothetical protein